MSDQRQDVADAVLDRTGIHIRLERLRGYLWGLLAVSPNPDATAIIGDDVTDMLKWIEDELDGTNAANLQQAQANVVREATIDRESFLRP